MQALIATNPPTVNQLEHDPAVRCQLTLLYHGRLGYNPVHEV